MIKHAVANQHRDFVFYLYMDFLLSLGREMLSFYNAVAIYLVLGILIAGLIYIVLPENFIRRHLGARSFLSVLKSAGIGVPLPLCSCGVVPVAASMHRSGASRGAVTAFLVSTPQVGPDSYLITYSLFGGVFAMLRVGAALLVAFFTGLVFLFTEKGNASVKDKPVLSAVSTETWKNRLRAFPGYVVFEILGAIANPLVFGIVLAGLITALIPQTFVEQWLSNHWASLLFMLLLSIPLYVCASASTPVAASLMMKGVSPGGALVFLLVGPATNVVTVTTVARMMGKRFAALYVASVAVASIALGWLVDTFAFQPVMNHAMHAHNHADMLPGGLQLAGAITLAALLAIYYVKTKILNRIWKKEADMGKIILNVEGMTCTHCAANVKKAVMQVGGTHEINVDLNRKRVEFNMDNPAELDRVKAAISDAGYEVKS
jgi:uncharacterized protein